MLSYGIAFDNPWFLLLLVLVPALWWFSYRSLAGLGRTRRLLALGLRTAVLVLLIFGLAEMQLVRSSDRLTVIYLLDQSLSVPEGQRRAWIKYVNQSIKQHRSDDKRDRAGVIVFGRDAAVEIPPFDDDVAVPAQIESLLDPEYTDLAGAMKLAMALFPHDAAKRIVIVSDGNENLGDALSQAKALVDAGVSIDVAPISIAARSEVAVEKIAVSSDVRQGQPFDMRVVLNNTTVPRPGQNGVVRGKVTIVRQAGGKIETLAEAPGVELPPGKKVLRFRQQIDAPDFYTYEARFEPDNPADDAMPQNNRATTFTHVRGQGRILLIEDWQNKGEFDHLISRLQEEKLEITVQPSNQLFNSLPELQRYDSVILADVPRSSGEDADQLTNFTDEQIDMLVQNTKQMGGGLVMIGGPNSYGAGGWTNTELEKAMPVDFQIKSAKFVPVGALAMLMHASEMARGNHWQKKVAVEAIKALGAQDYCGLLHWSGTDQWLWGQPAGQGMIKVGPSRKRMLARLDRMTPGDMPQFDPAMALSARAFAGLPDAAVKHMIIISDGDPSPPSNTTINNLKKLGVKISTVAVGTHGPPGSTPLQRIATATGGKYYVVNNPKALPRIYQREARRVARPLVYENKSGLKPRIKFPHEMIKGLTAEEIPPITGFVLTSVKDSPLVEVALVSPLPTGERNATILAGWTYGAGKAVAMTTDAGRRWATSWTGWANYDRLFSQIVRWSMRPMGDVGNFTVATDIVDGKGQVVITALDKEDEYLNFLDMTGSVVGPDNKPRDIEIRQIAPGRYVGQFDATDAGSFFVMVNPGAGKASIRTGLNVPYSDEFRDRQSNVALLKTIVKMAPKNAEPGQIIEEGDQQAGTDSLLAFNPFRHDLPKSSGSQDVWHLLVLIGSCLFFADVFNRRVQVSFAWMTPYLVRVRDTLLRREPAPVPSETMSRLRSRKAAVEEGIDQRRATTRFEPTPDAPVDIGVLHEPETTPTTRPQAPARDDTSMTPGEQETSYTERLLKAKKKVWEERKE